MNSDCHLKNRRTRRNVAAIVFLAASVYRFCGCGSGLTVAVPSDPSVSSQAAARINSVTNFGDSITCGYDASPRDGVEGYVYSTHGYAGLLDAAIGKPSQNLCKGGDQAADMARLWVYPNAVATLGASQLYTVMIGINDANACGPSVGCLSNYSQSLAASLAWLALPATDKVLANTITDRSGSWTPDFNIGLVSSSHGSSLNFTVQQTIANRSMYLGYRVSDASPATGVAVVLVDGVPVVTLSAGVNTGHSVMTQNGTQDTIFLTSIPLGAVGQHKVEVQTTSPDGAAFSFLWAGVSSANYTLVAGAPRVIVGGITTSKSHSLVSTIAIYNPMLTQIVSRLAADGLNIQIAPTATALYPDTQMSDPLHPNTIGHVVVADAFASVL